MRLNFASRDCGDKLIKSRAIQAFMICGSLLVSMGCNSKTEVVGRGNLNASDIYEIDYGDGLLQESITLADEARDLEKYERGELPFPKARMYLSTPYDEQNISNVTAHESLSPGIRVSLTQSTTPRAAQTAFHCEVIYKLAIMGWPAERFGEIPDDACQGVRFLWLKDCVLDRKALERIGRLPSLEGLWLTLCRVPDGDLTPVTRPLKHRLKILSLFHSGLKNDSVSAINELRLVYVMGVSEPAITNEFFERLKAPLLRSLEVPGRGPPNRELTRQLRQARPALNVMYGE